MQGKPIWSSTWKDSSRLWAKMAARGLQGQCASSPCRTAGGPRPYRWPPWWRLSSLHPLASSTLARQVQGAVERGLPAHGGQQRIGFFLLDDAGDGAPLDRLDIGGVGHGRVGHDRRRVGVHQDHPVALFPQGLAGLGAGVIEFAGLADDDGAGAENQDTLMSVRLGIGDLLFLRPGRSRPGPVRGRLSAR